METLRGRDVNLVRLRVASLTSEVARPFRHELRLVLDEPADTVIDLSRVRRIATSLVGALASAARVLRRHGRVMILCAPSDEVRISLGLCRQGKIFVAVDDHGEALRHLRRAA